MGDFDVNTGAFRTWLATNFSYLSPKFSIADLRAEGQGRGLVSCENIEAEEVLFKIPRNAILNVDNGALGKENKELLLALNQWQALILTVAFEWFLGTESKWHAYFDVVPLSKEDYSSLMFWDDNELKLLEPSTVLERISKKESNDMYDLLLLHLKDFNVDAAFTEWFTRERFHVVASLILAYSFDVDHPEEVERVDNEEDKPVEENAHDHDHDESDEESEGEGSTEHDQHEDDDQEDASQHSHDDSEDDIPLVEPVSEDSYFKSMVPLADTLNSNTTLCNATLNYEHDQLIMKAIKPIKKGDQIFNIYGELPNSEILRKYGYVELPGSKFEFAQLAMVDIMSFFIQEFQTRLDFIKGPANAQLVTSVFELIQNSEYLAAQLEDSEEGIVLPVYEVYSKGELLPELILLLLILNTLINALESDQKWAKKLTRGIEKRLNTDLEAFIHRTILKCHQMLENHGSVTQSTVKSLVDLAKCKILAYPEHITKGFVLPTVATSKKDMADVVLYNEFLCLQDIVDGKFPHVNEEGLSKFHVIEDAKLLNNVLKRKLEQAEQKSSKRSRK